jgi:hypothetical protein
MPRPKTANDTALSLLLPGDWLVELEKLAVELSPPGAQFTRADAIRVALRRGIDALNAEHGKKGGRK